jgi:ATP-dependent DNA ligase
VLYRRVPFSRLDLLEMVCSAESSFKTRRYRWDVGLTQADMKNCRWLRPLLVAQIEFAEWTPDGHLRHSSFAGLRDDKDPRLIVRE